MKAVAFTDVMQGIVLMIGIFVLLGGALYLAAGDFAGVTQFIAETEPAKVGVPDLMTSVNWFSILLLVGFGAAIYPHAIQRIYSAQSERTLKRSFARMAWMPPITTGFVFILIAVVGSYMIPLSVEKSRKIEQMTSLKIEA